MSLKRRAATFNKTNWYELEKSKTIKSNLKFEKFENLKYDMILATRLKQNRVIAFDTHSWSFI